ncbi:transportin-3 [Exaiptasia diaphana]|uniref:Transportin-3 n=1 Tax=Exaiptasia diaphana TaxID=2652724 RepID=A0A913XVF5_EXADI|nr:transportin-3 [Exaiptasia diaphana]
MEKPSVEQVQSVINTLYSNPDPHSKEKASEWLGNLQRSMHAWEIADNLLMMNINIETTYFAAQTMRTKIQYCISELQHHQYESLKDSIINHLSNLHSISQPVVTQLCLALADLAVQMPQWTDVVSSLYQRFGSSLESLPILLEILTVLPEEVDSHHLRVGANRREGVLNDLRGSANTTLYLLSTCLEKCPASEKIRVKIFRCAGSWILLGAFPPIEIANSKLLSTTFEILSNPTSNVSDTLHEAAADFICNALYTSEDIAKHQPLAEALFKQVMLLPPAYEAAINEEDFDRSLNLCRVFTEMGESFLEQIVHTPGKSLGDLQTLNFLLTCVQHNQYEIAEVTFNFWYRLSESIFKLQNENQVAIFKPYFEKLIAALSLHCRMEPDHEGIPGDDNEFGEFRERVADLIKDCVFIVGSTSCFQQMYLSLVNQSSQSWEISEAILFVMATIARSVSLDSELVSQFLPVLLNLPTNVHIAVKYTSIRVIGELAEWIEKHPDFIDPLMQFLLTSVQTHGLSSICASAIESICLSCHKEMGRHFDVLAQVVAATDSLSISGEATLGMIKGVSKILEGVTADKVTDGFRRLCSTQVNALSQIVNAQGTSPDPTLWLDRLAAVFRFTEHKVEEGKAHPCQEVIEEVWPIISSVCDKYQMDNRIIERCCRCIRFAIRCIGKSARNLLTPLVPQMVRIYEAHRHSCFLYLASILVDEYGDEQVCIPGLLEMTKAMSLQTLQLLSGAQGLVNHPDTIDDLYRLSSRCLQKFPLMFLQCNIAVPAIQCAIAASTLQHREANASVMKFLKEMIHAGTKNTKNHHDCVNLVHQILSTHGQELTKGLINACAGGIPTYMVPEVADVIWELLCFSKQDALDWVGQALHSLPTQAAPGHIVATREQLQQFHQSISSARSQNAVWKAAKVFSRLFM